MTSDNLSTGEQPSAQVFEFNSRADEAGIGLVENGEAREPMMKGFAPPNRGFRGALSLSNVVESPVMLPMMPVCVDALLYFHL